MDKERLTNILCNLAGLIWDHNIIARQPESTIFNYNGEFDLQIRDI